MRDKALQSTDTTQRREIVRRASAHAVMIWIGVVLALLIAAFAAMLVWSAQRTGAGVADLASGKTVVAVFGGLAVSLTMMVIGYRRVMGGDTVAAVLAPEGVALPEQSVPNLPWPHITGSDRTYGRGARLRVFLDAQAARQVRPHGIWRIYARLGNLHPRDALTIAPLGLALDLDQLLALIRAYASAHGGPQSN